MNDGYMAYLLRPAPVNKKQLSNEHAHYVYQQIK